jgi:hypothetical protein
MPYFSSRSLSCPVRTMLDGIADVHVLGTDECIDGRPVIDYMREGHIHLKKADPHPGKEKVVRDALSDLHELKVITLLP